MKEWMKPEVEELGVEKTMQGQSISTKFDEIRVDQNGNYWASFASGAPYDGPVDGDITLTESK